MIEVFKTNVTDEVSACILLDIIRAHQSGFTADFDLDDCDRILRVQIAEGAVCCDSIVALLKRHGWEAEVLPD